MRKRMLLITVLVGVMLAVCSCSGNLNADDKAGVVQNGAGAEDNAGGDDQKEILDGITPGQIDAVDAAREDIKNGDLTRAMIKLEQDAGYEGADDLMLVNYLMDFEHGEDVEMSSVIGFMKKQADDDFIIETLGAVPAVQEYAKLCGEYTCGDITLTISDDGSALRQGTDEDGKEYEERRSIYYGQEKFWLDNRDADSEPALKEYIEISGEDLIITVDGNEYTYVNMRR